MKENVLVLRKYTLKYCEVKGHDVQVNISSFSPLDHHILDTLTFSLPHQKDKHVPSSGPLHLLFLLPGLVNLPDPDLCRTDFCLSELSSNLTSAIYREVK